MPCEGPIHLRRAIVADAAGIAQVYVAGWRAAHADLVPPEFLTCMRSKAREEFWRADLETGAPDRKPWVALIDDRVVGFAIGGMSRDDDVDTRTGEVYQVYVEPECWRRGIGSSLLRHVLKDLHGHGFKRADIWVIARDASARAFAEEHGWSSTGHTRHEDCGGTQIEQLRYSHPLG